MIQSLVRSKLTAAEAEQQLKRALSPMELDAVNLTSNVENNKITAYDIKTGERKWFIQRTTPPLTLRNAPGSTPAGPRIRPPRRRKKGELTISLMVILLMLTSSSNAPSTVSSASPRQ